MGGEGFATEASIVKADVRRQHAVPGSQDVDWGNPEAAPRPVREYLAALEETNQPAIPTKSVSLTDPASS